jgi:hypothetical protein
MKRIVFTVLAAAASIAIAADSTLQPGTYDYTVKMEIPGMPFAMPPQNFSHCVTAEDVAKGQQYQNQQNADCEVKNLKQSAGKATFHVACKDGTTGKAEYTFGADHMTGKTVMTKDGQPMTMTMTSKRVGPCK